MTYTRTIELKHNEELIKLDKETGEITELPIKPRTYKEDSESIRFQPNFTYQITNTLAWELLRTQTTKAEFVVAHQLGLMAKAFTNSLSPLNDCSTSKELANLFKVSVNTINSICKKLFELGVYGKFEVSEQNKEFKKYWIFNPYLSFNGKFTNKNVIGLFSNTTYAKMTK